MHLLAIDLKKTKKSDKGVRWLEGWTRNLVIPEFKSPPTKAARWVTLGQTHALIHML